MGNVYQRIPWTGTFELTGRCNLGCKMCLVRVDHERIYQLGLRERTAQEWISMAEQVAKAGTLNLLLTGGEVTLRPDFTEIYEAIAKMGFVLTVFTNATMITDKVMDVFRKYPPHKIGVTLYGASNETYHKMCGSPDGFDRVVDGIRQLKTLPSVFDIRTTIIKDNLQDLHYMKEFVKKEFGPEQVLHISRFVTDSVRGGITHPKEVRISPKENVDLIYPGMCDFRDRYLAGEVTIPENTTKLKFKKRTFDYDYLFEGCKAGIDQYAINWAGRMYACELLTDGYTEPFKEGFIKAWERLPEQYPDNHEIEKCSNCMYSGFCESCPANRLAETGEWFGIPEYACEEAKYTYELLRDINAI